MTKDLKVIITDQVAESIEDQDVMDLIVKSITAIQNGEELPEGVEVVSHSDGLSEDDVIQIMAEYEGKRSEEDLDAMLHALMTSDFEEFARIVDREPRKVH